MCTLGFLQNAFAHTSTTISCKPYGCRNHPNTPHFPSMPYVLFYGVEGAKYSCSHFELFVQFFMVWWAQLKRACVYWRPHMVQQLRFILPDASWLPSHPLLKSYGVGGAKCRLAILHCFYDLLWFGGPNWSVHVRIDDPIWCTNSDSPSRILLDSLYTPYSSHMG